MNKTFTLYWLDGKREFVTGPDIARTCTQAGYSNGAKSLDAIKASQDTIPL